MLATDVNFLSQFLLNKTKTRDIKLNLDSQKSIFLNTLPKEEIFHSRSLAFKILNLNIREEDKLLLTKGRNSS